MSDAVLILIYSEYDLLEFNLVQVVQDLELSRGRLLERVESRQL